MNPIIQLTATETAKRIRAKSLSVAEVVAAHLLRIEDVNPSINAITDVIDGASARAAEMDAAHPGDDAPPLWGVPVTVKVNVDMAGQANTNGVMALKDNIADQDSPVVAGLKAAGAVIVARTNTPEFSLRWFTSNPLHGTTLNPWDSELTPGGSSGGAAAAIAAGMGTIGHGNDLGGSLRYPAFCCGVASIRPSLGRIGAFNPSAPSERPPMAAAMAVQGPIARTVADLRLALTAMAARTSLDPMWSNPGSSGRQRSDRLRVGYSRSLFSDGGEHPLLAKAMDDAITALRSAGVDCVELDFPLADRAAELWGELLFAETDLMLGETMRALATAEFVRMYEGYLSAYRKLDFTQYLQACGERVGVQRAVGQMFDDIDAFLAPTSLTPPFANDLDFTNPEKLNGILKAQRPLHIVNLLGLPAVAVPTELSDAGPVGVQLIAPMHDDVLALDLAERLETEVGTLGFPKLGP